MHFIYIKPVHPKLLKSNDVVFSRVHTVVQTFELCLKRDFHFFETLHRVTRRVALFHIIYAENDVVYLLLDVPFLALFAHRDFFKLRETYNYSVIFPCRDPRAEGLAVFRLKVALRRHEYIRGGV